MTTVCPNCRNPTAVDATECVKCGASFSGDAGWKPASLEMLARSAHADTTALRRGSIVATVLSMLCMSTFGIYFLFAGSMDGLLFLVPFTVHAIVLFLLLQQQPGTISITISISIGALGTVFSLLLFIISSLAGAFHNTALLFIPTAVYSVCQVASVILGSMWKSSARKF